MFHVNILSAAESVNTQEEEEEEEEEGGAAGRGRDDPSLTRGHRHGSTRAGTALSGIVDDVGEGVNE